MSTCYTAEVHRLIELKWTAITMSPSIVGHENIM